ncbi:uncharacterized protein ColSpa_00284 [Colletotrichum spaethianum]|uniref:Uncharacterized protein n=1 Tax=Colletotrichum spaethianum TaxID=700344 RepID=A0AA37NXI7_9PEZI|nr:uncharacterized protein ColSpa_00284 [Colletotrichum spaethianum]GKT40103.1 hypothetical protein ColSpa_00284 [Colletotrichum spaethianum]
MTSPSDSTPAVDQAPILFRANKKRKAGLRQRVASPDDTAVASSSSSAPNKPSTNQPEVAVPTTSDFDAAPAADEETESHIPPPSAIGHASASMA